MHWGSWQAKLYIVSCVADTGTLMTLIPRAILRKLHDDNIVIVQTKKSASTGRLFGFAPEMAQGRANSQQGSQLLLFGGQLRNPDDSRISLLIVKESSLLLYCCVLVRGFYRGIVLQLGTARYDMSTPSFKTSSKDSLALQCRVSCNIRPHSLPRGEVFGALPAGISSW